MAYLPTFGCFFVVNVGKYTSPMDPVGLTSLTIQLVEFVDSHHFLIQTLKGKHRLKPWKKGGSNLVEKHHQIRIVGVSK